MVKTILITGGCGFIGHHFVEHIILNTDWNIIIIDKLSYASMGLKRLEDEVFQNAINSNRLKIFTWDLVNEISVGLLQEINDTNIIVHMAAETHVDNSIEEPVKCIKNNIMSTVTMLELARKLTKLETFFYFSFLKNLKKLTLELG